MPKKHIKQGAKAKEETWRDNWQTPEYILKLINRLWISWYDPCPPSPPFDSLRNSPDNIWWRRCFINPPFSKYLLWAIFGIAIHEERLRRGLESEQIWISHTSNDVKWYKKLLTASSAVILIDHRVKFVDPRTGEQSTSTALGKGQTLFYIGTQPEQFIEVFKGLGQPLRKA